MSKQTFGLTITEGPVQGKAIHYAITETGTFEALSTDLDYSAWEALTEEDIAVITAETRATSFKGWDKWMPKEGK